MNKIIDKLKNIFFKYKSQILYLFFGGLSTLLNIIIFFILNSLAKLDYQLANVIAWIVVVIFAYITNKIWVFESKTKNKKQLLKETSSFFIARLITLGMEFILLDILIEKLHILEIISKIIINVIVIVVNYLFSKLFIFSQDEKSKIKPTKIIQALVVIIFFISIISLILNKYEDSKKGYTASYYLEKIDNIYTIPQYLGNLQINIANSDVIKQKFNIIDDNAKYIYIYFQNDYMYEIRGKYKVEILNNKGEVLIEQEISNKYIISSKYELNINGLEKGEYTLRLTSLNAKEPFRPLYNINSWNTFYLNDKLVNGNLDIAVLYTKGNSYLKLYIAITAITIVFLSMLIFILKNNNKSLETKFLLLSIPIYIMYLVLIPPGVGHDESYHWNRVFEITEGGLVSNIKDNKIGYELPSGVILNTEWSYGSLIKNKPSMLDYSKKEFTSNGTMAVYSPIQYLPQVIGVSAGKCITNNSLIIFYIGRIFNILSCLALLYLAIKKIPYGKNVMFLLAFIPILIEGATTLSGDGILISVCYYFMAYILNIINKKDKLVRKDYVILSLLGVFIAFSKLVYIPVVSLLLLIPHDKFKSRKDKIIKLSIIISVLLLINIFWLKIASPYLTAYTEGKSSDQIALILSNPFKYFQALMSFVEKNGINLLCQAFGRDLLWGEEISNNLIPIILIITTLITVLNDDYKKNKNKFNNIIIFAIILIVTALIATSLYIQWTEYGLSKINGVQGRYFLPILPLMLLLIRKLTDIKGNIKTKTLEKIIIYACLAVNYIVLMELISRFI